MLALKGEAWHLRVVEFGREHHRRVRWYHFREKLLHEVLPSLAICLTVFLAGLLAFWWLSEILPPLTEQALWLLKEFIRGSVLGTE